MRIELTSCQSKAFHLLETRKNVFLTGAAGTGKSELLRQWLRGKDRKEYPVLASTGAAAVIVDGRTFHSFFGLGILEGGKDATVARALKNGRMHSRILKAQCVVIDEVSMLSGETLATAEAIARRIRETDEPWGGLQVVAVGDFAQLPPVQVGSTQKDWAFLHPVWEHSQFVAAYLDTPVRTQEPELLSVLRSVRQGDITNEVRRFLDDRTIEADYTFDGTLLYPHRASVDSYNSKRLCALPGEECVFESLYEGRAQSIEQLQKQCPIPQSLALKKNALVMLRKNDTSYPYSYVNGSLATVVDMNEDYLTLRLMTGENIEVGPTEFSLLDGNGAVKAQAINFPVTLAWSSTIHKSQGASIDRMMVSLTRLWESGHAYVALSRVRSADGLRIQQWDERSIFIDPLVTDFYERIQQEWLQVQKDLPSVQPDISMEEMPKPQKKKKVPNHIQTQELLKEGASLESIAETLGWKVETIISHMLKLVREDACPDVSYLKPPQEMYGAIARAFTEYGDGALKPIYDEFRGKYSYRDIKLVRVFMLL